MDTFRITRRTVLTTLRLTLGGGVALVMATGCPEQPGLKCAAERTASLISPTGPLGSVGDAYAATYKLVSGSGACAEIKGETLGVYQYSPDNHGKEDFSKGTLAIQSATMGVAGRALDPSINDPNLGVSDPDASHHLYAIGNYTSMDPKDGICSVPTMRPAILELPFTPFPTPDAGPDAAAVATDAGLPDAVAAPDATTPTDAGVPTSDAAVTTDGGGVMADAGPAGQAAVSYRYEWSNVKLLMTPEFPGNAFTARLKVTQNGCTATYNVDAIFPHVPCGDTPVPGFPAACNEAPDAGPIVDCDRGICSNGACVLGCSRSSDCPTDAKCDGGVCMAPADLFCGIKPRPELGITIGSGIASNMPVKCDKDLGMCVLTKPVNQLQ